MPFAQLLPSRKFSGKERQRARGNCKYRHLNSRQGIQFFWVTGAAMANVCSGLNPKQAEQGTMGVESGCFLQQETIPSMPGNDN